MSILKKIKNKTDLEKYNYALKKILEIDKSIAKLKNEENNFVKMVLEIEAKYKK